MADQPAPNRGPRGATGKTGTTGRAGKTGATGRTGKQAVTPDAYLLKADELQVSLDGVREELSVANQRSIDAEDAALDANKTAKRSKRASRLALAAAVLALVGLLGVWRQNVAIVEVRAVGRITTCQSERRFQVNHNNLVAKDQAFIATLLTDAANDPENRSKRDLILDYAKARVAEFDTTRVPVRKCDDPSIALFYKSKGALGCETTPTNPDGKCLEPKPAK